MSVRRITANLAVADPSAATAFYARIFGLETVMNLGFVATLERSGTDGPVQLQVASEGGAGTPVPRLSIEVDDLDPVLTAARSAGAQITYGPVDEPWGLRRFFFEDPDGNLINVLCHGRPG